MSKKFWNAHIDDIQNAGCTENEINALMDIFCYATRTIACTLARKAEFDLKDFITAQQRGVTGFTLILAKTDTAEAEQWAGIFEAKGKCLKVLGMLERDQI
ncbi:MAG: hypothetical protein WC989_07930 [Micavibrio sp.]